MKLIRKIKALILRTFVTDCPACHEYFYGRDGFQLHAKIKGRHYRIICHRCVPNQDASTKI